MGWLIALAILTMIAILPLGVSAKYDQSGVLVRLVVGLFRFTVYPAKKKENQPQETVKETKKEDKPKKKADPEKKTQEPEGKFGGKLKEFYPLIETALALLNDLRRKLRVDRLEMKLILAGDDPCDLAVNYGRAWAALGNLMPQLERVFVIKKRDLQVECDFTADEITIYARIDVTITVGRLLYLLVRYGVRAIKQYLKIQKGGAVT